MTVNAVDDVPNGRDDLRPDPIVVAGGGIVVALISAVSLSPVAATASIALGLLMIAGAEIDARTYLLPNAVTLGSSAVGLAFAPVLDPLQPGMAVGEAVLRAVGTALVLECIRRTYARARQRVGLGFGDVKLAMAIGVWLPVEEIALCFGMAASAALVLMLMNQLRGKHVTGATKIPFGTFLCPTLWALFYLSVLPE
jgi:leader peptidase (prepilin peptidase) / N-methyltransferase